MIDLNLHQTRLNEASEKIDQAAFLILGNSQDMGRKGGIYFPHRVDLSEIMVHLAEVRNLISQYCQKYFTANNLVSGKEDRQ